MSRDEVLEHRHTLFEVRENRVLNSTTSFCTCLLRLGHQTTHTSQLLNLVLRTTGSGIQHHINSVEALVGLGHLLQQDLTQTVVDMCPGIDNLVVTLVVGDEAHVIVIGDGLYLIITFLYQFLLLLRDDDIIEVEGKTGEVSHTVTKVLDTVEELTSLSKTNMLDHVGNDVTQ